MESIVSPIDYVSPCGLNRCEVRQFDRFSRLSQSVTIDYTRHREKHFSEMEPARLPRITGTARGDDLIVNMSEKLLLIKSRKKQETNT